jgi:hypothetical protein
MKLVISTIAALAIAGSAFKLDKKDATTLIRSKRANHEIVDLATVNSGTGAGATFWANLERECAEEQCGLEEAIETYEEFGAQAKIQVKNSKQQSYEPYVNEYVSKYLKDNDMRASVQVTFDKFYTKCYEDWKNADDKKNRPGLTDITWQSKSDDASRENKFQIGNEKGSIIDVMKICIKKIDSSQSVEGFLNKLFNIWMYEHVE